MFFFFFQAEDGIRDHCVTGVQTCALPISLRSRPARRVARCLFRPLHALPRYDVLATLPSTTFPRCGTSTGHGPRRVPPEARFFRHLPKLPRGSSGQILWTLRLKDLMLSPQEASVSK